MKVLKFLLAVFVISLSSADAFTPPLPESVMLSNGMRCYLLEDHSLPIIQGKVLIKGGTIYEDLKKAGVSGVTSALLKDGGTVKHKADELRSMLDENAVGVSFVAGQEFIEGNFDAMSKDKDFAMQIFFEILFEPAFDDDSLTSVKKRVIDGIKREKELSGSIVHHAFKEMVYGKNTPWGRNPDISSVKRISKKNVVGYYDNFFSPDKMILAVAGDFNKRKLLKTLEALAKLYPKRDLPDISMPTVAVKDGAGYRFIRKKFTQSAIDIGHLGSTRDNPDKYAITLFNDALGGSGSFTSRLQDSIRVKNGYAYEVWSAYSFGPAGAPGLFQIHAKTRTDKTNATIDLIKNELAKIVDNGITKDEFKRAKEGILNKLIFEYERPFDIVSSVARFAYFGYPENYIEVYRKAIKETTLKQVNEAVKRYLHPDLLKIVVVGKDGSH